MSRAILIQARLSSSRFPKKMLEEIQQVTLLEYVYKRCKVSKKADKVIIITSNEKSDDLLYDLCIEKNMTIFRGDLNDVIKRYIDASNNYKVDVICRVCGDSPFVDIQAIDEMFDTFINSNEAEYIKTSNVLNGFTSEVFTLDLLKKVYNESLNTEDKEHVTKYILDNYLNFNIKELDLDLRPKDLESFTLTVDYPDDILIAQEIAKKLEGFDFTSKEVIEILKQIKEKK